MQSDRWSGVGFAQGAEPGAGALAAGATLRCGDALAALGGRPPLGMLAFDCIARRGVLGEAGIVEGIGRLTATAPGVPVAGFYT